jgi:hypothetical protein
MNLFQRLKRRFGLPIKIGQDDFGNKYYEKINKDGKNFFFILSLEILLKE